MKILVANLGSTSFKYRLFDMTDERVLARGGVERIGSPESRAFVEASGAREELTVQAEDHAGKSFGIEPLVRRLTLSARAFNASSAAPEATRRRLSAKLARHVVERGRLHREHHGVASVGEITKRFPGLCPDLVREGL